VQSGRQREAWCLHVTGKRTTSQKIAVSLLSSPVVTIRTFCPRSVFMCFVWICEQTAIISLYSINWLVCITETESVYCAVRTGSLYIIQVMCFVWIWEQTAIISLYSTDWQVCITETECVYCAVRTGSLYIIQVMCFVWIWEQTAIISLYSTNWLVCITETECVYCAVRTGSLYVIHTNLKPGSVTLSTTKTGPESSPRLDHMGIWWTKWQ